MDELSEGDLLERARDEEKKYNWIEASNLYQRVKKSFLDEKMVEEAAKICKKQGFAYSRAARIAETTKDYAYHNKLAVETYREALILFSQINNKAEMLECEAEAFYYSGIVAGSLLESKEISMRAYKLFIESSDNFSAVNDRESVARTLSQAAKALESYYEKTSEQDEIEQGYHEHKDIREKAWEFSRDVMNLQYLSNTLRTIINTWLGVCFVVHFKKEKQWEEIARDILLKYDDVSRFIENSDDSNAKGEIYFSIGMAYCSYGLYFLEDMKQQRECADKGITFLERATLYARETKDKPLLLECLFYIDWWASWFGRFDILQERIIEDLDEIAEIGKVFVDSWTHVRFYTDFFPTFYYANMAQRGFFPVTQRKYFAEKACIFGKKALKTSIFGPLSIWVYQMLSLSHSQLVVFTDLEKEQQEHVQKMVYFAEQALKSGERYRAGFARAAGYSSIYRANKTLAEIEKNEEAKIKWLSLAADAVKRYAEHALEGRAQVLIAYMRAGLLYEEIGMMSGKNSTLLQAKESFLDVINESSERGFWFYCATAHEHIAHIEDRLHNHMASAEQYNKAREAYFAESLTTVDYSPLKNQIQEKIDYTSAWILIEKAKDYHIRGEQLKAKQNYEKASEILNKLKGFNYEAQYYDAWALQEDAELFSMQDRVEEAKEQYERARNNFTSAMNTLDELIKQSSDRSEIERLESLLEVARLRQSYCSARINLEEARILRKQGDLLTSAEMFDLTASQFKEVLTLVKIEQEKGELKAVYYLCRAWGRMVIAEKKLDPDKFLEAANLFDEASVLFTDSKLKLLASGNTAFCKALEKGCKIKKQLFNDVKKQLKLAAEFFSDGGYENKAQEVLERLVTVEKEESNMISVLNIITEPLIYQSTKGIITPSSHVEISRSLSIRELRQYIEEARKVLEKR
ncbi:MAG: tetratricopeptide repeat protein [Candidatus Hodarchaeales archaeon]